jgi:hypothetical protein
MRIYELWGSTGSYSDYTEYRLGFCSSQEKLDETVARLMAMPSITQGGPHSKKEKEENYIVHKDENGHWHGRVLWQQYAQGLTDKFAMPRMSRAEEMDIWSNVMDVDEDLLPALETRYL